MSAEIAKLRYLHFPRYAAAAVLLAALGVGVGLLIAGPTGRGSYADIPSVAVGATFQVVAITFGVWAATLEFGSGTLQRTLTAEPDRSRVLGAKLTVLVVGTAALGVVALGAGIALAEFAADNHNVAVDRGDLASGIAATFPPGLASAVIGFGFGLLTRSMGGGIALSFAFIFVLDGLLSTIPGVRDLTYGIGVTDVQNGIAGDGDTEHGVGVGIIIMLVWMAIIIVPGWLSFLRGDLK